MKRGKRVVKYVSFCLGLGILVLVAFTQVSITYAEPLDTHELRMYLRDPRVQAFLDTIAYSEGTLHNDGYNTQFGHYYFKDFKDHPRQVICTRYNGNLLCSSAAGRYQFLQKTWDEIAPQIKANNFGPLNQDLGAVALLAKKNVLSAVPALSSRKDFARAIYKVNKTWAGLPGAPYGQPKKTMAELEAIYQKQLTYHKKNQTNLNKKYTLKNMKKTPTITSGDYKDLKQ